MVSSEFHDPDYPGAGCSHSVWKVQQGRIIYPIVKGLVYWKDRAEERWTQGQLRGCSGQLLQSALDHIGVIPLFHETKMFGNTVAETIQVHPSAPPHDYHQQLGTLSAVLQRIRMVLLFRGRAGNRGTKVKAGLSLCRNQVRLAVRRNPPLPRSLLHASTSNDRFVQAS